MAAFVPSPSRVFARVALVLVVPVAYVCAAAFLLYVHIHTQPADTRAAGTEFARVRAQFTGHRPMIELRSDAAAGESQPGVRLVVHREPEGGGPIHELHALSFDPRSGRLTRVDLPHWLIAFSSLGGRIRLANLDVVQHDGERLTLADLDARGPGLVVDLPMFRESALLVWTE